MDLKTGEDRKYNSDKIGPDESSTKKDGSQNSSTDWVEIDFHRDDLSESREEDEDNGKLKKKLKAAPSENPRAFFLDQKNSELMGLRQTDQQYDEMFRLLR